MPWLQAIWLRLNFLRWPFYSNSKSSVTLSRSPCRATALSAVPLRVTNDLKMELRPCGWKQTYRKIAFTAPHKA